MNALLVTACLVLSANGPAPSLSDIVALGQAAPAPQVPVADQAATPAPLSAPRVGPGANEAATGATPLSKRFPSIAANDTAAPTLGGSLKTWLLLGLFAGAGLLLLRTKKRGFAARTLSVVERIGLSKGRELVLVRVGEDVMLLSSSDKGVQILRDKVDVTIAQQAAAEPGSPKTWAQHLSTALHGRVPSLDEALEPILPDARPTSSKTMESTEDAEIRRKLMSALSAKTPAGRHA